MATVRIKLHGIELIVTGDVDGHQWFIETIELSDEDQLTDLILNMDTKDEIETLCGESYESEVDEDAIYEQARESKY